MGDVVVYRSMLVLEMNDCLHLVLVRLCRSECLGLVLSLAQDEHPNIVQKNKTKQKKPYST